MPSLTPYNIKILFYDYILMPRSLEQQVAVYSNPITLQYISCEASPPPTVGSDVTLRQNWSVFIRCRTMPLGAALAL